MASSSRSLVSCPCPCCCGRKVSSYVRKKHSTLYTLNGKSEKNALEIKCTEDDSYNARHVESLSSHDQLAMVDITTSTSTDHQESDEDCDEPSSETVCDYTEVSSDMHVETSAIMDLVASEMATTPLYESAPVSVLQALQQHFTWFTQHPSVSKEAFSEMLYTLHHGTLPHGNLLPDSYDKAMAVIKEYVIKPVVYHCCPNDCITFRGDTADLTKCSKCGTDRYLRGKIPAKSFTYFPLKPRLIRMFETPCLSEMIQSHKTCLDSPSDVVYDIQQSRVWKHAYSSDGLYQGDVRGVSLALCADGVNPFHINRVQYSMCPIVLSLLNLPRHIRYKFSNMMLVGIIPGPKEPLSMNSYIDILVDELLELNNLEIYDAYKKETFNLRVNILSYVLDYPGIGKLFHTMGSGAYQGCVWCEIQGFRSEHLHKVVYLEHRRFLPMDSDLRDDDTNFPSRCIETRAAPMQREYRKLRSLHMAYDNTKSKAHAAALAKDTGCKGMYPLMDLPLHDRISQTCPDMMHTLKDTVEKLFCLMIGKGDRESIKKAQDEVGQCGDDMRMPASKRRRMPASKRRQSSTSTSGQLPPYSISSEEVKLANNRARTVVSPSDFSPGTIFTKTTGLKSHDWKELACCGILKFCLRGMLGDSQRQTLFYFLDTIALACSEGVTPTLIDEVDSRFHRALALIERDFPICVQDITMHILHHVGQGLRDFGPVYSNWMYPYERFNSWMCRRALNRRRPEATIVETYRTFEWCNYVKMSGLMPDTYTLSEPSGVEMQLDDMENRFLRELYLCIIPRYKYLTEAYNKAIARSGKKKGFPSKEQWQPPFPVNSSDRELLIGPKPNIVVYKKFDREDPHSKRTVTYTSSESDSSISRTLCSYVSIGSTSVRHLPRFGRIRRLFHHNFAGTSYMLALIHEYKEVHADMETGLWWVEENEYISVVALLSSLSSPLFIGRDESRLWFLNYKEV